MIVMEQCYSGAFIDIFRNADLTGFNTNQKRYIMTAAASNKYSYGNAFAQAWFKAVTTGRPSMKQSFITAKANDAAQALESPTDGAKSTSPATDPTTLYLGDPIVAKSIKILTPNGGESWQIGTTGYKYPVCWTQTGFSSSSTVNIELWNSAGSAKVRDIATSQPALAGMYGWTISASFTAGSYKVKIVSVEDSTKYSFSAAPFTITNAGSKGTFNVKSVKATDLTALTGAKIYIDTLDTTKTTEYSFTNQIPININHIVRVDLLGYYSPAGTYTLTAAGETQTPTFKMVDARNDEPPYVTLAINSVPPGALVKIQDMQTGDIVDTGIQTPGTTPVYTDPDNPTEIKQYKVSVSLDGYNDPDPQIVNVNKETTSPVYLDFVLIEKPKVAVKTLIVPNPLNLGKTGYFLALVKLPTGYKAADVDAGRVYCEKAKALRVVRIKLFPHIFIGIFSRQDLGVYPTGSQTLNVKGLVMKNGEYYPFLGSDNVNIINKPICPKEDVDNVLTMTDTQIFTKFNKL
jgi:hypothetical protein